MRKNKSAESKVKEIRRHTRKKYSAEEKIRIIIEGLRGETSVAELCRREDINANLYYKWSKEFLEAGKSRLAGDIKREATTSEAHNLKSENTELKQLVAELSLENRMLKKKSDWFRVNYKYMRRSASEKMEIIRIVQDSELGVKQTLEELGISRSTFYVWYKHYFEDGFDGLNPKSPNRKSFWNEIPKKEKNKVIEIALEKEDLSPRELACHITDEKGWFISESSVYRILKERGLVTSPKWILMAAADEFKDKTSRIHQQWQTDFTYFKIIGWGWYYLATIMDDYSRYIIHWELCSNMESSDAMRVVGQALKITRLTEKNRPRLLTDNGSCYVSSAFKEFIQQQKMGHVQGAPYHPQTQGKIERYHRTMKNVVKLENYYFPEELRTRLAEFVDYYNNHRYHESLEMLLLPAFIWVGRMKFLTVEKKLKLKP